MATLPRSLWGVVKLGAIRPVGGDIDEVDLVIGKRSVRLFSNDPGLKCLSLYRLKSRKVLILFWQPPGGHAHIFAVYVTDSEKRVKRIRQIMVDNEPKVRARLASMHPKYIL